MSGLPLTRRTFAAGACAAGWAWKARAAGTPPPLRLGLTPVFLDNQVAFLAAWRGYLQARLHRAVQFVQRGSYRDIVGLLQQGQLDLAWLCGYPFVRSERHLRLLAVPVYRGEPLYRSYLIVPAADRSAAGLLDLRGAVFAYSDPDSNSGHLYTLHSLMKARESPSTFFSRTFFTWGHRKVVEAVAVGLARGGAVDGYVWDALALSHPSLTARTRIVERSPQFGFPPFVARASLGAADFAGAQSVLLAMAHDAAGRALLDKLNLDGFVPGSAALYASVREMARAVDGS